MSVRSAKLVELIDDVAPRKSTCAHVLAPADVPLAPNPSGVRAWLLDLDGTLVDTHDANVAAYLEAIETVPPNAKVDPGELRQRIASGQSCSEFVPALVPGISGDDLAAIAAAKAHAYPSHLGLTRLNRELVARVRSWRSAGGTSHLVTTAKRPNAEAVLAHHGIVDLFDSRVYGDGIVRLKPAPDIYLEAMRSAGLCPAECLAFEDSVSGISAALAAGLVVVQVAPWL